MQLVDAALKPCGVTDELKRKGRHPTETASVLSREAMNRDSLVLLHGERTHGVPTNEMGVITYRRDGAGDLLEYPNVVPSVHRSDLDDPDLSGR
jgi:hypothetical protein